MNDPKIENNHHREGPGSERFPFQVVVSELGKTVAEGEKQNKKHSKRPRSS